MKMHSKSTYILIISILLSTINGFSQYQSKKDVNYLSDNALFFDNGILRYEENGKYGFVYKNHRITKPIYDTIFKFGNDYCIIKHDTTITIVDRNLKNTFYQPIRKVDKYYDTEKNAFVLSIQSERGFLFEYTTSISNNWKVEPVGYQSPLMKDSQLFLRSITDSIDNVDIFPEAQTEINALMFRELPEQKLYNKILYDREQIKFFPVTGIPFIRKRTGLSVADHLGESLIQYRDPNNDRHWVVINEEKQDTILIANSRFWSFSVEGNLYLFREIHSMNGEPDKIEFYNNKGKLRHTFTTSIVNGHKSIFSIRDGTIQEQVGYLKPKKRSIPIYNIYSIASAKRILDKAVLFDQSGEYQLYYLPVNRTMSILKADKIIYSFKMNKGNYVDFKTVTSFESGKKPICIEVFSKHEKLIESIVISSSGKVLYRSNETQSYLQLSLSKTIVEVHNRSKTNAEFAIYSVEKDSLYWFNGKNGTALTNDLLIISDKEGDRIETVNGSLVLDLKKRTLSTIQLTENRFLFMVSNGTRNTLYNENFEQVCDSCNLYPIKYPIKSQHPIFVLSRDKNNNLLELVDEQFNPIVNRQFRAVLSGMENAITIVPEMELRGIGNIIAVLTESNEIDYIILDR